MFERNPRSKIDVERLRRSGERKEKFSQVIVEQILLPPEELNVLVEVNGRQSFDAGDLDLHADELGADGPVVLVEPVGIGQPRRVLFRMGSDGGQESGFIGHGGIVPRPPPSKASPAPSTWQPNR